VYDNTLHNAFDNSRLSVEFISNFVNYIVVNKKAGTFKERFICYKLFKVFLTN
jgi:hypothetical protein